MPYNISDAEWRVMQVLWECGHPMTSAEIVEGVKGEEERNPRTIKTLLQRLVSKDFVSSTIDKHDSRIYHYSPNVSESECISKENTDFVSLYYKGDVNRMLARFIGDSQLTKSQIDELTALLNAKKEDTQ